jgi:hypothetical protein
MNRTVKLILMVFLVANVAQAQSVEHARKLELVDENLAAAIELYRGLVSSPSTTRPAMADALVGLGRSYQKTGAKEKARDSYERVLRDYGDQKSAVAQARARLASLGVTVTGVVTAKEARFVFLLPQRTRWEWFRPATPMNQMEYNWGIGVENGGKRYGIGFLLFKSKESIVSSTKIEDLLRAGQASLVESAERGSFSLDPDAGVLVTASGNWLTISVTKPSTLQMLFSAKPSQAEFKTRIPGQESTGKIPILYSAF